MEYYAFCSYCEIKYSKIKNVFGKESLVWVDAPIQKKEVKNPYDNTHLTFTYSKSNVSNVSCLYV